MRTYSPKASEITRKWWVIDAEGLVLGRLSTEAARLLRGKHKPTFAPHMDMGDHVIIINAEKVVLTANKADQKMVYRHSGYPGGLKSRTFAEAQALKPEESVRRAVRGMIPKNRRWFMASSLLGQCERSRIAGRGRRGCQMSGAAGSGHGRRWPAGWACRADRRAG